MLNDSGKSLPLRAVACIFRRDVGRGGACGRFKEGWCITRRWGELLPSEMQVAVRQGKISHTTLDGYLK